MNTRYCSTCSQSFDCDKEGLTGEFGIIEVAFCENCKVCLRHLAEQVWDLVPRDDNED
jgi:hypothetical protein